MYIYLKKNQQLLNKVLKFMNVIILQNTNSIKSNMHKDVSSYM